MIEALELKTKTLNYSAFSKIVLKFFCCDNKAALRCHRGKADHSPVPLTAQKY